MALSPPVVTNPIPDKEQAIHQFWNSFTWTARDENTVPDNAMTLYGGHYITYNVSTASLDEPVPLSASLWCKDTSWTEITAKAHEIADTLGRGGMLIKVQGGYVWIVRGTPFAQRMADDDDTIRRIYLNIMVEFLTEN